MMAIYIPTASCLAAADIYGIFVSIFKQLNSPNRILLLHLSVVSFSLSVLYLWILINNSIMQSPMNRFTPESAAITTVITTQRGVSSWDVATRAPFSESIYDSLCSLNDVLIHLLQPIGLWTISCINFDRYYAICSPLHYNTLFTTKKVSNIVMILVREGNVIE